MLEQAEGRLERWRVAGRGAAALEAVRARLDDDLDTPGAIEAIDEEAGAGRGVDEAASLLGVRL
jgi:L-cysteine:1D-myo-inositol 2-amino-2-deoxy-alpha-D-glucopyranoside ligase